MGSTRNDNSRIEQIGPSVQTWALGRSLLSLHASIFVLAAVGLLLLNLYRSPSELWVQGPLQLWGFLLITHAGLFCVGWATSRSSLRRADRINETQAAAAAPAPAAPAPPERAPARSRFRPPASATLSELRPHRVIRVGKWSLSWRELSQPVAGAMASVRQAGESLRDSVKPAETGAEEGQTNAAETGLAQASDIAQRARSRAGALVSRLPMLSQESPPPAPADRTSQPAPRGEPTPEPLPPSMTHAANGFHAPAGFAPLREAAAGFTPADPPARPEQRGRPSPAADDTALHEDPPRTAPNWATGLSAPQPAATARTDANPDLPQDTEWTWMEAAAAAWLARRTDAKPPPTTPRRFTPTTETEEDIVVPDPPPDDAHPS